MSSEIASPPQPPVNSSTPAPPPGGFIHLFARHPVAANLLMAMMIILGVFLPDCHTKNNNAGSSEIDPNRPIKRFEFDSNEQLKELINSLSYTPET